MPTHVKPTVAPQTAEQTDTVYLDLPPAKETLIATWSNARQQRLAWEKIETEAKDEIKDLLPKVEVGVTILIRIRNALRVKVKWGHRYDTDRDLLLQGFPEAFAATNERKDFQTVAPA